MKIHTTSYGLARREKEGSQDSFQVRAWDETVIAVVADGVGGARAGREASARIVESLVRDYSQRPRSWSPEKSLAEFTRLVNQRLYLDSINRYGAPELVSTLTVAVLEGDKLYGLNVGDSRIYLARSGVLRQLSTDHIVNEGTFRHVLSRAIGMAPDVEPTFFETDVLDGDVALLCTDGVSNVLDGETLRTRLDHRCSARVIVHDAREKATPEELDDMSAVVLEIAETGKLRRMSEEVLEIPAQLARGDVVEGYALLKPFQHSDRVWLASREGVRYTIKFAPVEAGSNEAVLHAFTKEVWHATRLQHPAFPKAFIPRDARTRCYVMEFVEAPSLKTLLGSRRLAVEESIALGRFLLRTSQYLLQLDLVHGDIKPENILVLSGYDAIDFRLVDFGSVTELFSVTSRAGTASYLAPERFREKPISEHTEIYAIGVTLYEALTGSFPYGEIERFQTPHFHAAQDPARRNPNLPAWLCAVLLRATASDPALRYQSYSEMLFDLERPDQVAPFHRPGAPLLERNPLLLLKLVCGVLLIACIYLLVKLCRAGVPLF